MMNSIKMDTISEKPREKEVHLDDILVKFNIFGRYYGRAMFLLFLAGLLHGMHCPNYIFVAAETKYWCKSDESSFNNTTTNETRDCKEWVYEDPHSFVAEFQLAGQEWKRTFVGTIHSAGYMVGLLIVGPFSDRFGRKTAMITTSVLGGVIGVMKSFVVGYWWYIMMTFLELSLGDISSPSFMLSIETPPRDKRLLFRTFTAMAHPSGMIIISLLAWLIPYWRNFVRIIYPPALFVIFYIYIFDESPRWLLNKGRNKEAREIIAKAAKMDYTEIDNNALNYLTSDENSTEADFCKLFKETFASRKLMKRFLICLIWWTTSTFVNYGLTINSVSLQGNKYINFALIGLLELPTEWVILFLLSKYKRKIPLISCFMTSAVLCLCQPLVPTGMPGLTLALYISGKIVASVYFGITYVYTSELFPTCTRNSMHALCSSIGRIGSIVAPMTPLLAHIWPGLLPVMFGGASLLAGIATLFVPDTTEELSLPDTIKQAEVLKTKHIHSPPDGCQEVSKSRLPVG